MFGETFFLQQKFGFPKRPHYRFVIWKIYFFITRKFDIKTFVILARFYNLGQKIHTCIFLRATNKSLLLKLFQKEHVDGIFKMQYLELHWCYLKPRMCLNSRIVANSRGICVKTFKHLKIVNCMRMQREIILLLQMYSL